MLSALTTYAIWCTHEASVESRLALDQEFELARLAERWSLLVQTNVARAKIRANIDLGSYSAAFDADFRATSALISQAQSAVELRVAGTSLVPDYRKLVDIRKKVVEITSRIAEVRARGDAAGTQRYLVSEYYPAVATYLSALNNFALLAQDSAIQRLRMVEQENRRRILRSILICVAVTVAAVLAARQLTQRIVRPLRSALSLANAIARGELGGDLRWQSNDEIGDLIAALKIMDRQLVEAALEIKGSSEAVSAASEEIVRHSDILSRVTEEQGAAISQTAGSMNQLTAGVKQNSDNARVANQLAINASNAADKGDKAVQAMVLTMHRIEGSSNRISEITGLIEDIAFRTNILALNAAVEAARAGERGRGFAVVANEVRTLARRAADATREINGLVDSSVGMVREGSEQVADVGSAMSNVKQAIKQLFNLVDEIAAASVCQSYDIEQVNQAVIQMEEATLQNTRLVEQATASAQSLEMQAVKLNDSISAFKISADRSLACCDAARS